MKKKNPVQRTRVIIVADLSGSMCGTKEDLQRQVIAKHLEALGTAEEDGTQAFETTIFRFSNIVRRSMTSQTAREFPHSEIVECSCRSPGMGQGTALRDAIGAALDEAMRDTTPALIQVFTDGEELSSQLWSTARLAGAIAAAEATGRITVAMAGPATARHYLKTIGIPEGNFRAWDGSVQEMAQLETASVAAVTQYTQQRKVGATRSTRFYADATNLTASGVKGYTKEVSPKRIDIVPKKMDGRSIADFYGSQFTKGNHYYELIKPEKIQESKDLIIFIKDSKEYRVGSRSVRTLLALPETGDIRVHPGPHTDKFTLFVQTDSLNRKLVEGQQLLTLE